MNVLVLNCGSSSLKFQVIATDMEAIRASSDRQLARGVVERIGSQALVTLETEDSVPERRALPLKTHREALDLVLRWLLETDRVPGVESLADIGAIGHRVVHGGEVLTKSTPITPEVIAEIEDQIELAPLHNPANLKGIAAATELFGSGVPQVAVFDTSFHATMEPEAFLYALPYQLYVRHKVRRYGFHGTSHRYVAYRYRELTGTERDQTNLITLHLGNGCSVAGILGGESKMTSMGLTPVEGLVMGTRSGDLDPSILDYLHHKEGMSFDELDVLLNKRSGLLGISGLTNDMRELLEEERENDDRRARLAIDIFCRRARGYIGEYLALMGGAVAIVFTGGIGENSAEIRRRICAGLEWLGVTVDTEANERLTGRKEGEFGADDSRVALFVIPTNEELLIARDTVRHVLGVEQRF
jgi:acetate kinase